MSRPSRPWFRESKNAWYVTFAGRKQNLGVRGRENESLAMIAWAKLLSGETLTPKRTVPTAAPNRQLATRPFQPTSKPVAQANPLPATSVVATVEGFLADARDRVKPLTWKGYADYLKPFAERFGSIPVEGLTVAQVEAYSRKPSWSATYRSNFLSTVVSAFRWAERERLIERNPLLGIKRPPKSSRGTRAIFPEDVHRKLTAAATPDFLELLWETGARPGEVSGLRTEHVDFDNAAVVLTDHKTAHHGKARVIFLTAAAVGILIHDPVDCVCFLGRR